MNIDPAKTYRRWMKFAGMFVDGPPFDEVQHYIAEFRPELETVMEEYYQQIETQENSK